MLSDQRRREPSPVSASRTVNQMRRCRLGADNRRVTELDPAPVLDALTANPSLAPFVRDRVVATMPAKATRRRALLNEVVLAFEPGVRYPERVVNDFLQGIYADHATLRRYLVDEWFLDRADGVYWRTGGSAETAAPEPAEQT
jgi:hypothetical protein